MGVVGCGCGWLRSVVVVVVVCRFVLVFLLVVFVFVFLLLRVVVLVLMGVVQSVGGFEVCDRILSESKLPNRNFAMDCLQVVKNKQNNNNLINRHSVAGRVLGLWLERYAQIKDCS